MNLQVLRLNTVYTIVLKDVYRAEPREIIEDLRVGSCETLEIRDFGVICICENLELECVIFGRRYTEAKMFSVRQRGFVKISEKGIESKQKRRKGWGKNSAMTGFRQLRESSVAIRDKEKPARTREGSNVTGAMRE